MADSDTLLAWQDYYRQLLLADGETYESVSGTEYTEDQLMQRIDSEIEGMVNGDYPSTTGGNVRPVPRIEDEEGNYILRDAVDQEWYDLVTGERYADPQIWTPGETSNGGTFVQYFPEERGPVPHQGWKVRVAAYADEAREIADAVLPYLQENDISHKVMQDVYAFNKNEGTRQQGKFITIYPEIDEDRQEVIMEEGTQLFKKEDPSWNAFSINSNTNNAREIIEDLEEELEDSFADLEGRSIDGKNGEEKQYDNTRIHFRYAHHFRTPARIIGRRDTEEVDDHQGLVNRDGELVEGRYIGDQINAATRPDEFL